MKKGSDPNTFIPESIRKAAEDAEKVHAKMYGKTEGETPEEETPPAPDSESPAGEAAPSEEPVLDETPAEGGEPAETPRADTPKGDWEQKYRVLEGKYSAEVPRLNERVRQLEQLLSLQMQATALPPKPQDTPVVREPKLPEIPEINEDDFKEYGPEMTDYLKKDKAWKKSVLDRLEAVNSENMKLKASVSSVHSTQAQTAQEMFWQTIEGVHPDFWTLNGDQERGIPVNPDFGKYLHESAPGFGGVTRFDILSDAIRRKDHKAIIEAVQAYKESRGTPSVNPSLQRQVAPSRRQASSSTVGRGEKPTMTRAEYTKRIAEVSELQRKGKLTDTDYNKRFNELHSALAEGRVVG